jgi:hypothetical protein
MYLLRTMFVFFILFNVKAQASEIQYINKVTPQLAGELTGVGGQLLHSLYQGHNVNAIDAFKLFKVSDVKKKGFTLKGKDVTILGKKSNADEAQKAARREMLARIIAIAWKIDSLADDKTATNVSYTIIDPGHRLYNFLMSYYNLAAPQSSVFAIDRNPAQNKSSHHKAFSPEGQKGLDVRFFANQASLNLLPRGFKHILFGKLVITSSQPDLLFMKFESAGIAATSEKIAHGLSFIKSRLRSKAQLSAARIERVIPDQVYNGYMAMVNKLTPAQKAALKVDDADNIREMVLKAMQMVHTRADLKPLLDQLMATLKQLYPHDGANVMFRIGNEYIIDLSRV